jgi:hypothetical protein
MRHSIRVLLISPMLLVGLALAPLAYAAPADDDEAVRDPQNIIFEGATSFDAESLRKRLALDIDIQVAGHPKNPLPNYLKHVEEVLVAGYRTSGFPKARAEARFDTKQRRVIVRIHEGQRYCCSEVRVKGLDDRERAELVNELTHEVPPPFAVPVVVSRDDGTTQTVWQTATGSPAKPVKPVWQVGEPASFDKSLVAKVKKRLTQWFWDRGRTFARYRAKVEVEEGSDAAILVVTVGDPGAKMTIGDVEVEGTKINSPADVLKFLAIRPGLPFDGRLESQLERRLWESGRFIKAEIKRARPVRSDDGARVNLTVVVVEHPKAPLLAAPLEPYQQALLKLRDWVVQWTQGIQDEDLVFDAQVDASIWDDEKSETKKKPESSPAVYDLHVVTSPRNGQVISMQIIQHDRPVFAQTFVAHDQRAIFHSPLTNTHLELTHSNLTQLEARITLGVSKPKSAKDRGTFMNLGLMAKTSPLGGATPLSLKLELAPLAVLLGGKVLAGVECKSEAGILAMRAEGLEVQIDETTGRLIQFQASGKEFGTIRCRTVRGALQQEFDRQERLLAGSSNVYDAKRPESSFAVYWIGEYRRFCQDDLSSEKQASLAALQKLFRHWSVEPVAELFRPFLNDVAWSPKDFQLPPKQVQWAHPALAAYDPDSTAWLAGYVLPIYRELVPRTGWLWPLGRDGLFALYGRSFGTWEAVGQYQQIVDSGPFGHLTSALAIAAFSPQMSQKLASHAMKRLSAKSLKADYAPLLKRDSWLGRNILSLAEALRHLDDSEIEALVRFLPDESLHRQIADSLLIVKSDSRKSVRDVLPVVFEQLWRTSVKPPVETALKTLAGGKSPNTSPPIRDAKIQPASASK